MTDKKLRSERDVAQHLYDLATQIIADPKNLKQMWTGVVIADRLALTRLVMNECIVRAYTIRGKRTDLRTLDPEAVLRTVTEENKT